jgi:helicase required for RNAi-mediated heterochromatin assembly 1
LNPYLFTSGPHTTPEVPYLEDTTDGKPVIPKTAKSLDKSQYKAFEEATTREISLIQGPPGTGKTFTSVVILQSLVETQRQCHVERRNSGPRIPVLVTAQTNHALDQLLKKYKNNPGCGGVIRLGGRSNDEEISELTLAKQMRKNTPGFRHQSAGRLYSEAKLAITAVQQSHTLDNATDAKELRDHGLLSDDQYYSIVDDDWESNDGDDGNDLINWLGMPQSEFSYDAPVISRTTKKTGPPERRWQGSSGAFVPLPFHSGHGSARFDDRAIHLLRNARNLYNIRPHDRLVVYNYLQDRLRSEKSSPVMDLLKRYNNICGSIKNIRDANKIAYIQANNEIEVIGCTVTGLLKYSDIISGLRPQILLMEEAAEIREGDTIAGILPSIEHVVLLGDHQQLQPHVTMAELSREPYRINISMFERLIKQGVQHQTLLEQRRMIPCLRDIIQPFYPKLTDHAPTISKLPVDIPGVSQPLWWLQHDWPEAPGFANGDSVQNFQEAQMMVLFVEYLVTKQNFPPDRITMLTYYRGQVDLLNRELGSNLRLAACEAEWSVRTVDGFQGEENDIILLSLVRGPNGKAGFVTQENRAIVGLSRARLGLYIFGHKDVLVKDTPRGETWTKVIQQIKGNQGPGLPLCPYPDSDEVVRVNHPRQLRRLLREKKGRKARRTGQGSCSGSEAELQTIPTRTTSSRISGQGRAAKQGNSVGPETRLSKDSSRPGDLPALPQRGETDSVETLASELELISFDDVETIPLPQQFWPWDTTPLEPTPVAEEEIDLLDFEASKVATDGGGSNKFEMNKVAPAQVDLLS